MNTLQTWDNSRLRLTTRIHEWLADHVSWIQYPNVTLLPLQRRRLLRFSDLSGKERAWLITMGVWLFVILIALYSPDRTS